MIRLCKDETSKCVTEPYGISEEMKTIIDLMNSVDTTQEVEMLKKFGEIFPDSIDPFDYIKTFDVTQIRDSSGV